MILVPVGSAPRPELQAERADHRRERVARKLEDDDRAIQADAQVMQQNMREKSEEFKRQLDVVKDASCEEQTLSDRRQLRCLSDWLGIPHVCPAVCTVSTVENAAAKVKPGE
eukprot:354200-Amphidinium_carterae.1